MVKAVKIPAADSLVLCKKHPYDDKFSGTYFGRRVLSYEIEGTASQKDALLFVTAINRFQRHTLN